MQRILVVDDEPDLLELVRFNLSAAGFRPIAETVVARSDDDPCERWNSAARRADRSAEIRASRPTVAPSSEMPFAMSSPCALRGRMSCAVRETTNGRTVRIVRRSAPSGPRSTSIRSSIGTRKW